MNFIIRISLTLACLVSTWHMHALVIEAMQLVKDDKTVMLLSDWHVPDQETTARQVDILKRHLGAPQVNRIFLVENYDDDQLDKEALEQRAKEEQIFGASEFILETGKMLKRKNHQVVNIECRSMPYIHFLQACCDLFFASYLNIVMPAQSSSHPEAACALANDVFESLNTALVEVSSKPVSKLCCPELCLRLLEPTHLELASLRTYVDDFFHDTEHKSALEWRVLAQRLVKIPATILDVNIIKHILCVPEQQVYVIAGALHTQAIVAQLEKQGFIKTRECGNTVAKKIVGLMSGETPITDAPDIFMNEESIATEFEQFLLLTPAANGASSE